MKITINREMLLGPLQTVTSVVERRQALPILSNLLIVAEAGKLTLTATDMEVEVVVQLENPVITPGSTTLPARKLIDICRSLPNDTEIQLEVKDSKATVKCGRSRFSLTTLPASEYPSLGDTQPVLSFSIPSETVKALLESTQFAMAHQDVRYYLNGLLMEISAQMVRAVATDGHRLALRDAECETGTAETLQIIVPRKGISELLRLLAETGGTVELQISSNHLRVTKEDRQLTTKLIDGKFPDYMRVLPLKGDKCVVADRESLRQGLARTSILSNEKFRGVRLGLKKQAIHALAHNPEHEEAEEEIEVAYDGAEMEIGFNVVYLLDVLGVIKTEKVMMEFSSPEKSCLIHPDGDTTSKYVVMPMRL